MAAFAIFSPSELTTYLCIMELTVAVGGWADLWADVGAKQR